ncbi:MAG: LLM class flavin-dependent oxidoreductase [Streptomycetales bacterium]
MIFMASHAVRRLRFHWSIPASGGVDVTRGATARAQTSGLPDIDVHIAFCRLAENAGMDSVLVPIGYYRADPVTMAAAMGAATSTLKFMLASRTGIVAPTYFVQQVNTVSAVTDGRVSINSVAGHSPDEQRFFGDPVAHDERYRRADEFWTICRAMWGDDHPTTFAGRYYRIDGARPGMPFVSAERSRPEIYISGNSAEAEQVAIKHADCHLRFADAPDRLTPRITPVLASGTEVGLVLSMIVRPTRAEALRAAEELIERAGEKAREVQRRFLARSDSVGFATTHAMAEKESWLTPYLWIGAVPYMGPPSISLVGTPEDVAEGLLEFGRIGISQFIFQGRPDIDVMTAFGRDVLPLVRARESAKSATPEKKPARQEAERQ